MKAAEGLKGLDLPDGWHVDERIRRSSGGTGGYSCVSYLVSNKDGTKAFLKALDFSAVWQEEDAIGRLRDLLSAYTFERDLLYECKDRRLRRVVVPLADGIARPSGTVGDFGIVPYLILPMAMGDIHKTIDKWECFDLAWALRCLHHSAVGVHELHYIGVAHQDVKPSNVLVFPSDGSKLTDLGSASKVGKPSLSDRKFIAGDVGYAAPEQLYGWTQSPGFENRYLVDLYRLGSLVFFFFSRLSATQALHLKLSLRYGKEFAMSGFDHDLPYLQHAFAEAIDDLRAEMRPLAKDQTDEIVLAAEELCDPDPRRRGDPRARVATHRPQYDVQSYISRFDRLARVAELKLT